MGEDGWTCRLKVECWEWSGLAAGADVCVGAPGARGCGEWKRWAPVHGSHKGAGGGARGRAAQEAGLEQVRAVTVELLGALQCMLGAAGQLLQA